MTYVSIKATEKLLLELLQSQAIKQIEDDPPIYVRANRYQARIGYQHYKGWTFSLADAHRLLDILEQGRYKSIRDIAQSIGYSEPCEPPIPLVESHLSEKWSHQFRF